MAGILVETFMFKVGSVYKISNAIARIASRPYSISSGIVDLALYSYAKVEASTAVINGAVAPAFVKGSVTAMKRHAVIDVVGIVVALPLSQSFLNKSGKKVEKSCMVLDSKIEIYGCCAVAGVRVLFAWCCVGIVW